MNRAQRYSGFTLFFAVVLSLIAGILLEQAVVHHNTKAPKPAFQVRAPAGTAHATASITAIPATEADGVLRRLAYRTSCAPDRDGVVPYFEIEGCILAYLSALQGPRTNREGQPGAVTPQPYVLHPGKTPLIDPTQDAYYRSLLREGRFPTTGSDPGRPK